MNGNLTLAYFSMEIVVDPRVPTYAGGLGVLAGDTLRSAADNGLPMLAVTLLHRKGYLTQVHRRDDARHRPERLVLQHPAHDPAVCAEGLSLKRRPISG
jgi:glucan phosphorylase